MVAAFRFVPSTRSRRAAGVVLVAAMAISALAWPASVGVAAPPSGRDVLSTVISSGAVL